MPQSQHLNLQFQHCAFRHYITQGCGHRWYFRFISTQITITYYSHWTLTLLYTYYRPTLYILCTTHISTLGNHETPPPCMSVAPAGLGCNHSWLGRHSTCSSRNWMISQGNYLKIFTRRGPQIITVSTYYFFLNKLTIPNITLMSQPTGLIGPVACATAAPEAAPNPEATPSWTV